MTLKEIYDLDTEIGKILWDIIYLDREVTKLTYQEVATNNKELEKNLTRKINDLDSKIIGKRLDIYNLLLKNLLEKK